MSELDLAFDPAPDTVRLNEAGEPEPVQDRLRSAEPWIQDLNQWLELMRAMPGHACPDRVRDAEIVSLGLQLTDDATIAELNGSWRQKPHPTDVLSFAALDDAPPVSGDPCLELGDIIVSVTTARRQALEHGHDLLHELRWLVSHGFLHLLGWDHPDDSQLEAMLHCQEHLLNNGGNLEATGESSVDATRPSSSSP